MLPPTKKVREQITLGETTRFQIGERHWYITLNVALDGEIIEVFLNGASDAIASEQQEFLGKMVSLLLRSYIPPERIVKALSGIKSEPTWNDGEVVESVPDALAKMLQRRIDAGGAELLEQFSETPEGLQSEAYATPTMVPRPQVLPSKTYSFLIGGVTHRLTVTLYEGKPFEVWASADELGSESRAFHEALGRLVSIALRMEMPIEDIAAELLGVKSTPTVNYGEDGERVMLASATDATGRFISELAGLDVPDPLSLPDGDAAAQPTSSILDGITEQVQTASGKVYVTVNFDRENRPVEVFGAVGKAGNEEGALLEFACRLASNVLREGDTKAITGAGDRITTTPVWNQQQDGTKSVQIRSIPHAVTHVVSKHADGPRLPMLYI